MDDESKEETRIAFWLAILLKFKTLGAEVKQWRDMVHSYDKALNLIPRDDLINFTHVYYGDKGAGTTEHMREFVRCCLFRLGNIPHDNYASWWVKFKMEWFTKYANGNITSTKHGLDFFQVIDTAFQTGKYVFDNNEYDRNFALILQENGIKINPR